MLTTRMRRAARADASIICPTIVRTLGVGFGTFEIRYGLGILGGIWRLAVATDTLVIQGIPGKVSSRCIILSFEYLRDRSCSRPIQL